MASPAFQRTLQVTVAMAARAVPVVLVLRVKWQPHPHPQRAKSGGQPVLLLLLLLRVRGHLSLLVDLNGLLIVTPTGTFWSSTRMSSSRCVVVVVRVVRCHAGFNVLVLCSDLLAL